jgi:hypothetical protein
MPCNADILIFKIPGLCIGGGGEGGTSLEIGYLCFMKKGVGTEKKRFNYHQN